MTPHDEARTVATRVWANLWSGADPGSLDELIAEDYVRRHPDGSASHSGREAFRRMVEEARLAFPDLHTEVLKQVTEDDKVVTLWTSRGTHLGHWREVPASGRTIAVNGATISRVAGGKVAEEWAFWDLDTLRAQLAGSGA